MSSKTFNMGGQTRTITCSCGWSCRKSVREANYAIKIHNKHCELGKNCSTSQNACFDTINGKINGDITVRGNNKNLQVKTVISNDLEDALIFTNILNHK